MYNNKCNKKKKYVPSIPERPRLARSCKKYLQPENDAKIMETEVQCGKCNAKLIEAQWQGHNLMMHNNLAWIEGSTRWDFDNDKKRLNDVLQDAMKKREGNLICEECKEFKFKVSEYLSHMEVCGKEKGNQPPPNAVSSNTKTNAPNGLKKIVRKVQKVKDKKKSSLPTEDKECNELQFKVSENLSHVEVCGKEKENHPPSNAVSSNKKPKAPNGFKKTVPKVQKVKDVKDEKQSSLTTEDKETRQPLKRKAVEMTNDNILLASTKDNVIANTPTKTMKSTPLLPKKLPTKLVQTWRQDLRNGLRWTCSMPGCEFTSRKIFFISRHYKTCVLASKKVEVETPEIISPKKSRRSFIKLPTKLLQKWRQDRLSGQRLTCSKAECQFSSISVQSMSKHYKSCVLGLQQAVKKSPKSVRKSLEKPIKNKRLPNSLTRKWRQELLKGQSVACSKTGCQFASNSFQKIKSHYKSCVLASQQSVKYEIINVCEKCSFQTSINSEVLKHCFEGHTMIRIKKEKDLTSQDEYLQNKRKHTLGEEPKKIKKKRKTRIEVSSTERKLLNLHTTDNPQSDEHSIVLDSFRWTLRFQEKNYKSNLFKELTPKDYKLLNAEEASAYLPQHENSMWVKSLKKIKDEIVEETDWRQWKLFEGQRVQDFPTFFTGGPIWAVAWLPIPTTEKPADEFIAVSTHSSMDDKLHATKSYIGRNIIQIWNVGNLQSNSKTNPSLAYAITHEAGTVWCLEWCPSGCYKTVDEPDRMGLLAAAFSDGCIRVYSLVFPESLPEHECLSFQSDEYKYPIYDTKPSLTLIVNKKISNENGQTWQVTKLSWTKENGHDVIAAGFSNGYVALWNLSSRSQFLRFERDDMVFLQPYRLFLAHFGPVSMIYIVPQDGKRFLATAGLDRLFKFWDLEDVSNPKNVIKKSFITDGTWFDNWYCAFITGDESIKMNSNFLYCLPIRQLTYNYYDLLPMNTTSYTVSTSNFGNGIASGTLAGEVLAMFPNQLINIGQMRRTLHQKRLFSRISCVEIVDFGRSSTEVNNIYSYMPSTYKESEDRFGLIFCDETGESLKEMLSNDECLKYKKTFKCQDMNSVPPEQHTFMSVNRVSWNPNALSFHYLAVAYDNGFVRCIPFNHLDPEGKCIELISQHLTSSKSE